MFIEQIEAQALLIQIEQRKGQPMTSKVNMPRLHTTAGELVVAITDAARRVIDSERNAYRLTGFVLNRMLQPAPVATTRRPTNIPRKARVRY